MNTGLHLHPARDTGTPRVVGRYLMYEEISRGGMASVHFGRLSSDAGFSRTVAIKHLHPNYARDEQFISMFLDEAHLASRIRHPNVVTPLDVVVVRETEDVYLVMEYVHGETLAFLIEKACKLKVSLLPRVSAAIVGGALHGLHAAHEAVNEKGEPLNIVHRDISPQNIMVGADGVARVLDFGVAKAASRLQSTQEGQVKGKIAYMSPEQLGDRAVDRRADIFAAGIVLWEALAMRRLFRADNQAGIVAKVLHATIPRPSSINGNVSQALDRVVLKALNRNPAARFQTAQDFASAIEEEAFVASTRRVSEWVAQVAAGSLVGRAEKIARIERESIDPSSIAASPHSAESLRTTSQTVAILRESELLAEERRSRQEPRTPTPCPRDVVVEPWNAPSMGLKTPPPEPLGSRATPIPIAESPTPPPGEKARRVFTVTALLDPLSRRKGLVAGVLASVAALIVAVGIAVHRMPEQFADRTELELPISAPAPEPLAVPSEATPPPTPVAPIIVPSKEHKPQPRAARASAAHVKAKRTRLARRGRAAKKDCDPPFFIDPNGIRRIKAQCL